MSLITWITDSLTHKVVYRTSSKFNPVLEVVRSGNKLILDAKSVNYSHGGLHRSFRQVFRKIRIDKLSVNNVLILGFGAGSVASILQHEYGFDCRITGVEIDPEVLKIGRQYFALDSYSKLILIEDDAFHFIKNNRDKFDLIVVDLYIDKDVPAIAESDEFALSVKNALKLQGLMIFNKWVYDSASSESALQLLKSLNKIFTDLHIYRTGHNRMNRMIVCRRID
jgi:spermidine synthase